MSLISGELRGADDWRPSCTLTEMSGPPYVGGPHNGMEHRINHERHYLKS